MKPLTEAEVRAFLAPFVGPTCPACGREGEDVGWETWAAGFARVSDDLPPLDVVEHIDRDSLWWCSTCDRGGGLMDLDGERIAVGVGATCSMGCDCGA